VQEIQCGYRDMGEPVKSFGQAVRDGVKVHQRCQLKVSISDIQTAILTLFTGQIKLVIFLSRRQTDLTLSLNCNLVIRLQVVSTKDRHTTGSF